MKKKAMIATGDCGAYIAALGTSPPPGGFERLDRAVWKCLGWLDVGGYTFKNTESTGDFELVLHPVRKEAGE